MPSIEKPKEIAVVESKNEVSEKANENPTTSMVDNTNDGIAEARENAEILVERAKQDIITAQEAIHQCEIAKEYAEVSVERSKANIIIANEAVQEYVDRTVEGENAAIEVDKRNHQATESTAKASAAETNVSSNTKTKN